MGISKVNFGNDNLIDLTSDTVTENTLLRGTTAHNRSGESIVGTLDVEGGGITWDELEGYAGYNLCPLNFLVGTYYGITALKTASGITINLNGTASSTHWVGISEPLTTTSPDGSLKLFAGSYKLIVTSTKALDTDCYVGVVDNNDNELCVINSGTSGSDTFTLEADTNVLVGVKIVSGKIIDSNSIKTMVVKATIEDDVAYQKHLLRNDEIVDRFNGVDTKAPIGSVNDLNDFIKFNGIYRFGNGVTPTNKPSTISYLAKDDMMFVAVDIYGNVTQVILHSETSNTTNKGVWLRSKVNNDWSSWANTNKIASFNKNSVIHTFNDNTSWTATNDCFIVGVVEYASSMGNNNAYVTIDSIYAYALGAGNTSTNLVGAVYIPARKGQIIQVYSKTYGRVKAYDIL